MNFFKALLAWFVMALAITAAIVAFSKAGPENRLGYVFLPLVFVVFAAAFTHWGCKTH